MIRIWVKFSHWSFSVFIIVFYETKRKTKSWMTMLFEYDNDLSQLSSRPMITPDMPFTAIIQSPMVGIIITWVNHYGKMTTEAGALNVSQNVGVCWFIVLFYEDGVVCVWRGWASSRFSELMKAWWKLSLASCNICLLSASWTGHLCRAYFFSLLYLMFYVYICERVE